MNKTVRPAAFLNTAAVNNALSVRAFRAVKWFSAAVGLYTTQYVLPNIHLLSGSHSVERYHGMTNTFPISVTCGACSWARRSSKRWVVTDGKIH